MSQPTPFIAASADEALEQIRARLGPEAVVLNVRPLPANGLARLWQKPLIEVLAYVPETVVEEAPRVSAALAEFRQQLNEIREQFKQQPTLDRPVTPAFEPPAVEAECESNTPDIEEGHWRVGTLLQKTGLRALHAQAIVDELQALHGEIAPVSLEKEIKLARALLSKKWNEPSPIVPGSRHVLVGPSGSGKTTSLCKWLTQSVLVEGRSARVWRLDGAAANMAESLSVYCEILGARLERLWRADEPMTEDIGFLDLPGVDWKNPGAIAELGEQLRELDSPNVHLVLNGAYDITVLLAQLRAYAALPIADLIITHLDEESRWGKIWNLTLGSNLPVRYLGTGQNIPGDFCAATAGTLLDRSFLVNRAPALCEGIFKQAGRSTAM